MWRPKGLKAIRCDGLKVQAREPLPAPAIHPTHPGWGLGFWVLALGFRAIGPGLCPRILPYGSPL